MVSPLSLKRRVSRNKSSAILNYKLPKEAEFKYSYV